MLDLRYGLPSQIRDTVLGVKEKVPKNAINREYFLQSKQAKLEREETLLLEFDKAGDEEAHAILEKLSAKGSNPDRNLAPTCSFFVKGKCTRGDTCPFRHVLVAERYASLQSYRDRYYGENDPSAIKMLEHVEALKSKVPTENSAVSDED